MHIPVFRREELTVKIQIILFNRRQTFVVVVALFPFSTMNRERNKAIYELNVCWWVFFLGGGGSCLLACFLVHTLIAKTEMLILRD